MDRLAAKSKAYSSVRSAKSASGAIGVPMIGEFKNERGLFFDNEPSGPHGRSILCRFVWTNTAPTHRTSSSPLRRWRQNLGSQLDHGSNTGKR